jgi:hypothetical protein
MDGLKRLMLMRFFYMDQLVELVGYRDPDTEPDCFEWFEIFDLASGECMTDGWPLMTEDEREPSVQQVVEHLALCLA